jgi:hypothetical protein
MIATDGKSARGAREPDGRAVHLLAAFDYLSGVVLGQSVVEGKTTGVLRNFPDKIDKANEDSCRTRTAAGLASSGSYAPGRKRIGGWSTGLARCERCWPRRGRTHSVQSAANHCRRPRGA